MGGTTLSLLLLFPMVVKEFPMVIKEFARNLSSRENTRTADTLLLPEMDRYSSDWKPLRKPGRSQHLKIRMTNDVFLIIGGNAAEHEKEQSP